MQWQGHWPHCSSYAAVFIAKVVNLRSHAARNAAKCSCSWKWLISAATLLITQCYAFAPYFKVNAWYMVPIIAPLLTVSCC